MARVTLPSDITDDQINNFFAEIDEDGFLTKDQIKMLNAKIGLQWDDEDVDMLCEVLEQHHGQGQINIDAYINACRADLVSVMRNHMDTYNGFLFQNNCANLKKDMGDKWPADQDKVFDDLEDDEREIVVRWISAEARDFAVQKAYKEDYMHEEA